eukprot:m.277601 g.277601  ORF g.277601 m.277601 type:complete len:617 (+) comp19783_c0_seq3:181-2031(+)
MLAFMKIYLLGLLVVALFDISRAISLNSDRLGKDPIVHTEYGDVEGVQQADGVKVFHGVPFAAPPVKELRWKYATPPEPWTSPIKTTIPKSCPQFDFVRFEHLGSEDCLYLSVYVPEGCTSESPCPVMQWIYGGAWEVGSNNEFGAYNGANLAKKHGVVIVAANYRLDVFGWIALPELQREDPIGSFGNYGFQDQRFALQWTRRNIANFGGDANLVTIFGESAGGFSVCQHLASPASNKLFAHAIMESGSCDGPYLVFDGDNAKRFGSYYADAVGCKEGADRLGCLRELPLNKLMEPYLSWLCPFKRPNDPYCNSTFAAHGKHNHTAFSTALRAQQVPDAREGSTPWPSVLPAAAPLVVWAACVDGTANGLPDVPIRMLSAGRVNRAPDGSPLSIIMGTNEDEYALFLAATSLKPGINLPVTEKTVEALVNLGMEYHALWNQTTLQQILAAYPSGQYAHEAYRAETLMTDLFFRCPTRQAVRALSTAGSDVYLYHFDFHFLIWQDPAGLGCQVSSELGCGVFHGSEIAYVFNTNLDPLPAETTVANIMGAYWTNMAKFGSPNAPANSSEPQQLAWPKYTAATDQHMNLNEHPNVGAALAKSRCDVWDVLPPYGPYT